MHVTFKFNFNKFFFIFNLNNEHLIKNDNKSNWNLMTINEQVKWVSNIFNIITDYMIWVKSPKNMIIDEVINDIKRF
jgi:hypothetical protein